eukprot:15362962-Ditylum_brightwellii.AAC.1
MFVADLFLDTFLYGAHSTATDALMGGLPLLTVSFGNSFASRVGVSLLKHLNLGGNEEEEDDCCIDDYFIATSEREFVDRAVEIARNETASVHTSRDNGNDDDGEGQPVKTMLSKFRAHLEQKSEDKYISLFDTEGYTNDLERMSKLMWEVHKVTGGDTMHIILVCPSQGDRVVC